MSPSSTPRPIASVSPSLVAAGVETPGRLGEPWPELNSSPSAHRRRAGFLGELEKKVQTVNIDRLSPAPLFGKPLKGTPSPEQGSDASSSATLVTRCRAREYGLLKL
jgi:hypothetical protein